MSETIAANSRSLSIIAHDLRSPFASIMLALEFINMRLEEESIKNIKEYVKVASDAVNTTFELLNELFARAVYQNKDKSFNPVNINLQNLLGYKLEILNIAARQKQITLNQNIPSGLTLKADLQMVKTVLGNLIRNSIKFSEPDTEIIVEASLTGDFVEISVKDNGSGITAFNRANSLLMKLLVQHRKCSYSWSRTNAMQGIC